MAPIIASKQPGNSSYVTSEKKELKIILQGNLSSKAVWFLPIGKKIFPGSEIAFKITSTNIRTFRGSSNIFLVLNPSNAKQNLESPLRAYQNMETHNGLTKLDIFKSAGAKDSALGQIPIESLSGGAMIYGLFVELALREKGRGELVLSSFEISGVSNVKTEEEITQILRNSPPISAGVKLGANGTPILTIDGADFYGLGFSSGLIANKMAYPKNSENDLPLLNKAILNFGGENTVYKNHEQLWPHRDFIDFVEIDNILTKASDGGKNYVLIEILLQSAPNWWLETERKRRRAKISLGTKKQKGSKSKKNSAITYTGTKANGRLKNIPISDQSPFWRQYCENSIKQILAHIRNTPYSKNIIGCSVILGWGLNSYPYRNRDVHKDYFTAFQDWLENKYLSEARLNRTWRRKSSTFSSLIPLVAGEWHVGDVSSFIHPQNSSLELDSYLYYHESWSETLVYFCSFIKSLTKNRFLTGTIGGPGSIFNNLWNRKYQPSGQAIKTILNSPDVDYISIPLDSTDPRAGLGASGLEGVLRDELKKHDKLLFVRNEVPYFSPSDKHSGLIAKNLPETIHIHRRIFVSCLVDNSYLYYFPIQSRQFQNSVFKDELRKFQQISRKATTLESEPSPKLAFVIDFESFRYLTPNGNHSLFNRKVLTSQDPIDPSLSFSDSKASDYFYLFSVPRLTWNRLGVPFDIVEIENLNPENYQVLVFFHTFYLDEKRDEILDLCKNSGRTLVSVWANGFVNEQYLTSLGIQQFTGMNIQKKQHKTPFEFETLPELNRYMKSNLPASTIGWIFSFREPERYSTLFFNPQFTVTDKNAAIMANYIKDKSPALAIKEFSDWTSVYSVSPVLDPEFLRVVLKRSGVHLFVDTNDSCYINDSFIGIHTLNDGVREIKFLNESHLFEVFRGQELSKAKNHSVKLNGKKTYLFFRGDKKTWDSL